MADKYDPLDNWSGKCAQQFSERGWNNARLQHHLAHHGLIPWQAAFAPDRPAIRPFIEENRGAPRGDLFLSEASQTLDAAQ